MSVFPSILPDRDGTQDLCGAVKADGTECDRPADECPYHGS